MADQPSVSRRWLMQRAAAATALGGAGLGAVALAARSAAQDGTPAAAADPARLQGLITLSQTLCGGGTFDPGRATSLLGLLDADPSHNAGLSELLAPPASGTPGPPSAAAQAATQAILLYWYTGMWANNPIADRATAYYGFTSWQAMYTPPFAVCKAFGGWADAPRETPLVPANA